VFELFFMKQKWFVIVAIAKQIPKIDFTVLEKKVSSEHIDDASLLEVLTYTEKSKESLHFIRETYPNI